VESSFDTFPDDLPRAIRSAVRAVLQLAADDVLLRAIVSGTHGEDIDLLPPLTTRSESVLSAARAVVAGRLSSYDLTLSARELGAATDAIVRLVLSHVVQPSSSVLRSANDLAAIALSILRVAT
jgi:hypothetical protein